MSILSLGLPTWYDQSVIILNQIIGSAQNMVDSSIPAPGSTYNGTYIPLPLFASMMLYFNQALLGCGTILFAIMVFVGTINTAAEGQFLGKDWHSIWTPVRLIFGLLFVVPLQSGLCIGQKIILYAVLIGVNMGTTVWQETINQIFNNSAEPPIPTYLNNSVTQMINQVFLTQAVTAIAAQLPDQNNIGTNSIVINYPAQTFYIQGSAPSGSSNSTLPDFAIQGIANQASTLCNQLYSGAAAACDAGMSAVLSGSQNQGYGSPYPNGNVNFYYWIGNPPTPPSSPIASGYRFNPGFWSNPNGGVTISGAYTYTFPPAPGVKLDINGIAEPPTCPAKPGDIASDTYCQVMNLIDTYVTPAGSSPSALAPPPPSCPQNPGSNQLSCSMQGPVTAILADAQDNVIINEFDAAASTPPGPPSAPSGSTNNDGTNQPSSNPPSGTPPNTYINYNSCPVGTVPATPGDYTTCIGTPLVDNIANSPNYGKTVYPVLVNLNDYWIPGVSQNSNSPPPLIDVQLNNSWWQAGSSYLIIDNQLSNALGALWNQLQTIMNQVQGMGASSQFAGVFTLQYDMAIWEVGQQASGGLTSNSCGPINSAWILNGGPAPSPGQPGTPGLASLNLTTPQIPTSNIGQGIWSCAYDEARGTDILQTNNYTVTTTTMPVPSYLTLIDPYNTDPNDPHTIGPNVFQTYPALKPIYGNLYQQLLYVPSDMQGPIAILLTDAQTYYNNNVKNPNVEDPSIIYEYLMPYLQGLLNVLNANGIMQNNSGGESLPASQVLTQIFTGLLGANASDTVASINSIIQQVYNLGMPPAAPGLVAKQFSLIQQAQTTGVSMIMVCVDSLENIVNHFESQYNSWQTTMSHLMIGTTTAASAATAVATGLAFNPELAPISSAISSAASISVSIANLVMQAQTIQTMTSIGMSLMYMPIVLFVLTSLFTAGVQFALIVPLTPYILFWAGQIAWLLGVLEAIIAAPIIMLGLAHPGGHQYMGHSVPAVKMLLSVVFRPVLMVIGMVTGILLTYVVITFSAQGFHVVAAGLLNSVPSDDQMAQGILACLMLLVYCSFIVLAFNKCFSTIYLIPDKVMEWVGGQRGEQAGAADMQQLAQGSQQAAGQAAQAGGEGAQKGISAKQEQTSQYSQLSQSVGSETASQGAGFSKSANEGVAGYKAAKAKKAKEDASKGKSGGGDDVMA